MSSHDFPLYLIPLLPLLGAIVNAFFGWRIQQRAGKKGVALVAVGVILAVVFALAGGGS